MANRNIKNKNMKFKNVKVANGGVKKRLGQRTGLGDARQKLIQKKRNTVVDARDILAGKAKIQDARSKLLKMREKHTDLESRDVRAIGSNILRKTDRNGKISLVTNKNRPSSSMNLKIQQQLGIISPNRTALTRPVKKTPKRPIKPPFEPPVIKKTIRNEYSPSAMPPYPYEPQDLYRWYPGISPLLAPIEMRRPVMDITVSRGLVSDNTSGDWRTFSSSLKPPNGYIDLDAVVDDEEMPLASPARPGMTRTASNIHSRLDAKPVSGNSTHGILSHTKTKVVVPVGHRIVVSNLQSTVTQDDIRELFEDIGQLLVARLVRPGTAEVIYKNLKDAQKAVDTYHNRQLDGQPMKCLLVNKRPVNNPTAPAIKSNNDGLVAPRKPTSTTNSNKLVPDISTIHKVLFQRN